MDLFTKWTTAQTAVKYLIEPSCNSFSYWSMD